ncbi:hypothetical protein PAPHI01_1139 [Pancytospora philotis]|nr:hypothetical protein PAPHI01_1139 [Pancytospora philotis]
MFVHTLILAAKLVSVSAAQQSEDATDIMRALQSVSETCSTHHEQLINSISAFKGPFGDLLNKAREQVEEAAKYLKDDRDSESGIYSVLLQGAAGDDPQSRDKLKEVLEASVIEIDRMSKGMQPSFEAAQKNITDIYAMLECTSECCAALDDLLWNAKLCGDYKRPKAIDNFNELGVWERRDAVEAYWNILSDWIRKHLGDTQYKNRRESNETSEYIIHDLVIRLARYRLLLLIIVSSNNKILASLDTAIDHCDRITAAFNKWLTVLTNARKEDRARPPTYTIGTLSGALDDISNSFTVLKREADEYNDKFEADFNKAKEELTAPPSNPSAE